MGCERSHESAAEWFEKAARQGHAGAQCSLGDAYKRGQGVPKSDEKAFKLYEQSAAQGDSDAQHNIGMCYGNGHGCEQSDDRVAEWYEKAALQGHPGAKFALFARPLVDFGILLFLMICLIRSLGIDF